MSKKYLAKIIAKDYQGLQVISACCTNAKINKNEIKYLPKNKIFQRIQLINKDHLIQKGLYCCGTVAGWRSQFAIAAGSGASVATDILTLWNDGNHTKIHDKKPSF